MKLLSGPLSLFTAKTRITLAEKGLDYELVSVPWSREKRYEPKHPEVVAINPKKQVPCLIDGEAVLYDSTVIAEYLEDRYPEPALFPKDPVAKARCRLLELEADEVFFEGIWGLISQRFYPPTEDGRDSAEEQAAAERIHWFYDRLEGELGEQDFLCGAFSVADIAHFIFVHTAITLGEALPESAPRLAAWYARILERPSIRKELEGLAEVTSQALAAA